MSERVARVSEVICGSTVSFDDAIKKGFNQPSANYKVQGLQTVHANHVWRLQVKS